MKKLLFSALFCLMLGTCVGGAQAQWQDELLDGESDTYSAELALEALDMSSMIYSSDNRYSYIKKAGLTEIGAYNITRAADDTRHVCAYWMYRKALPDGRNLIAIIIRGTGSGEWKLNMDIMPSGDYDANVAENFTLAAQDILDTHKDLFDSVENPVFLVTGHSRGAACANVAGKMLTDLYGAERVYCYTFASPCTVRGEYDFYGNIFNIINPCDYVPCMPLPQWGFERYGTDIILPSDTTDEATLEKVEEAYKNAPYGKFSAYAAFKNGAEVTRNFVASLAEVAPTVRAGYTELHSLTHAGAPEEGEEGVSGLDFLEDILASSLNGSISNQIMKLMNIKAARTDFDGVLNVLFSAFFSGELPALASAHMPATYRAWMTVMNSANP